MNVCIIIIALIIFFIIVIVIVNITTLINDLKALKTLDKNIEPICTTDISANICQSILEKIGPVPNINRTVTGFDQVSAFYAINICEKVLAFIGTGKNDKSLLSLPDMNSYILIYSSIDSNPFACIWLNSTNTQCVISFRGTSTIADARADLNYNEITIYDKYKVHGGMYNVYSTMQKFLLDNIPNTVTSVFISGHSLGAALAYYMAMDLIMYRQLLVDLFVIAPPRSGDKNFANYLSQNSKHITSLINLADIVPSVPWSYMPNFKQTNNLNQFSHVFPVAIFNNLRADILSCHMLPAYFEGVNNNIVTLVNNF